MHVHHMEPGAAERGTHHSTGTAESVSVYTSRSNVHVSCSSGRKVTLAVICGAPTLLIAQLRHSKLMEVELI